MFLNSLRKGLPKCNVAHSIRQSYLYKKSNNNDVNSEISKRYPLTYYYIRKQNISSFYYKKNNLIAYYIHSTQNNDFHVIPLYNYLKNDYEIVISDFLYNPPYHHEICLVRAPNRQIYICTGNIIGNVSKGTLLYNLSDITSPRFLSMPIANSFLLVVAVNIKEIVIYIIDLIKERKYVQKYPIEKIIDTILSSLEGNDWDYIEIESLKKLDRLSFGYTTISNIENINNNLVFYNRCVVRISLYFGNTKTGDSKFLIDVLSVDATYQNKKLTVNLQINDKTNIKTSSHDHEVVLSSNIVLMKNIYKIDDKYDISKSHLYSVIAYFGDYTIISEPYISRDIVTLYYKDKPNYRLSISYLDIDNFDNILFIRLYNKLLVSTSKHSLIEPHETSKYYLRYNSSNIDIIDTKVVKNLIKSITHKNSDKKLVGIDITDMTDIVIRIHVKNKLEQALRPYACSNDESISFFYTYYIDHDEEEFYALTYFSCLERIDDKGYIYRKHKFYLFRCKIVDLISGHTSFRLVRKFEFDNNTYQPNSKISIMLINKTINGDYGKVLRLLGNKWNTGITFTDLKILDMYDTSDAYYDFGYNRISIKVEPTNTSITSKLSLVRRIAQTF